MPRANSPFLTFQPNQEELEILDKYCKQVQRSKTEVLRELVRNLKSQILEN